MLFCDTAAAGNQTSVSTAYSGKVRLGGGFRLAAPAAEIRLGGGYRLPAEAGDAGKDRLGGALRLTK